jgi:hypothetical protein
MDKILVCTPPRKQLSPAFDSAKNLPISWSFLLAPLLGAVLPQRVASLLGFRATSSSTTPGTWTASTMFHSPETDRTGVQIVSIDATTVRRSLKICRRHGAKLTGVIHQFIMSALSESLPQSNIDNFAAGTALDMRRAVGASKDDMGLYVSGDFQLFPRPEPGSAESGGFSWDLAKSITERLAVAATELRDQPVGLLRYLSDMRSWMSSKLGQARDCSYAVSNLTTFQPSGPMKQCSLTDMVFCQPTDVTGPPLTFCVLSAPNGPMNIAVNWQIGALDLGSAEEEVKFVKQICERIEQSFTRLASTSE